MVRAEIITVAKNAADAWRGTDTYHQAAQIIDMLVSELEGEHTLTPPNEPLTLDKKRAIAESCLHYSKSGCCLLRGYAPLDCPRCKEWQSNEANCGPSWSR